MRKNIIKLTALTLFAAIFTVNAHIHAQDNFNLNKLTLNNKNDNSFSLSSSKLMQKPTKKIYFTYGGKIGMFFLQGDYNGHQLIALEGFGKYVGDAFSAEITRPFR